MLFQFHTRTIDLSAFLNRHDVQEIFAEGVFISQLSASCAVHVGRLFFRRKCTNWHGIVAAMWNVVGRNPFACTIS
jgi:hypothetical protein